MTDYFWDLAIDANAVVHPANADFSYLQNGFCSETAPASPVNLRPGEDTVQFRLFDVTNIVGPSAFSIASVILTFQAAVNNQASRYPFDEDQPIPLAPNINGSLNPSPTPTTATITFTNPGTTVAQATSPIFSGESSFQFPLWRLIVSPGLDIETSGRYLFSAEVTANDGTSIKKFRVDPEMIVEGVG